MRTYALKRWNWSDKAQKWVYVEKNNGKRSYKYSKKPPKEFEDLSIQIRDLNQKLMTEKDPVKNIVLYKQLIGISQKMQAMRE
jgi:hypothetical protein